MKVKVKTLEKNISTLLGQEVSGVWAMSGNRMIRICPIAGEFELEAEPVEEKPKWEEELENMWIKGANCYHSDCCNIIEDFIRKLLKDVFKDMESTCWNALASEIRRKYLGGKD